MYEANKLVLAVAEDAAPVNNWKDGEDPLSEEGNDCHFHEIHANYQMVVLNIFQLFRELGLLLHVASLFFATSVSHFLADVIHTILAEWISLLE